MKASAQLALVAALAGGFALNASAATQITSTASLSGVYYSLQDLNLNDGIDPSISFSWYSQVNAGVAPVVAEGLTSHSTAASFSGSAHLMVSNAALGATTSASINGWNLNATGQATESGEYYSSAHKSIRFTLSPNTSLFIGGFINAGVSSKLALPDVAGSNVWLQIINSQNANPYTQSAFYSVGAYSYNDSPTTVEDQFYLNMSNAKGSAMNGTIDIYTGAWGTLAPVPEPSTYAMMLAGLGLLGAAARRKRN